MNAPATHTQAGFHDVDGIARARRIGLLPHNITICAGRPWGFPNSARLVVDPQSDPARIDFSLCFDVDVVIGFDNNTPHGWLLRLATSILASRPRRLQAWNLDGPKADDLPGTIFFLKLGRK